MKHFEVGDEVEVQAAILVVHEVPTAGDIRHVPRIENLRQSLSKISSTKSNTTRFEKAEARSTQKHLSNTRMTF